MNPYDRDAPAMSDDPTSVPERWLPVFETLVEHFSFEPVVAAAYIRAEIWAARMPPIDLEQPADRAAAEVVDRVLTVRACDPTTHATRAYRFPDAWRYVLDQMVAEGFRPEMALRLLRQQKNAGVKDPEEARRNIDAHARRSL